MQTDEFKHWDQKNTLRNNNRVAKIWENFGANEA